MTKRSAKVTAKLFNQLATGLHGLARRFGVSYERGNIGKKYPNGDPVRLPPTALDLWSLYRDCKLEELITWLRANKTDGIADHTEKSLEALHNRLAKIQFEACKILNNDPPDAKETTGIHFAFQLLGNFHYDYLREKFPDHDHWPERSEMPEEMAEFEVDFLDEWSDIKADTHRIAGEIRTLAALVADKEVLPDGPTGPRRWAHNGVELPASGEGMQDRPWRFSKATFDAMPEGVLLEDLAEPVEGDRGIFLEINTVKAWQSRANKFFKEQEIPLQISLSGRTFTMSESPELFLRKPKK